MNILSWELTRSRIGSSGSSTSNCGHVDSDELNRSCRLETVEVLLAVGGGVGNSGKNLAWRGVSCNCGGEKGPENLGVW